MTTLGTPDAAVEFDYDQPPGGEERPTLPKARDSKEQRGIPERNLSQV